MQHLNCEEIERFLDESDFSETYLCWLDQVMEHLDSCEFCRKNVERARQIVYLCEEENAGDMLKLLEKEPELRRQLAAQKLAVKSRNMRMQEVAVRLQEGLLVQTIFGKADFIRHQAVMRGQEEETPERVRVWHEAGKIVMAVPCKREEKVIVILIRKDDVTAEPETREAVWSEEEGAALAEFAEEVLGEAYEAYIDIR